MKHLHLKCTRVVLPTRKLIPLTTVDQLVTTNTLIEYAVTAWIISDRSILDLSVAGYIGPNDAIAQVIHDQHYSDQSELSVEEALQLKQLCEICQVLYSEVSFNIERLFSVSDEVENINIDGWVANDLIISVEHF